MEKPPLGLRPRIFHDEDRYYEIENAMKRFTAANKPIPVEWILERRDLFKRLSKHEQKYRRKNAVQKWWWRFLEMFV